MSAAAENSPAFNKQPRRRFGLWLLLVASTLFYDGCENNKFRLSLGPVGPAATFEFDKELWPSAWVSFSPVLLACNLLAAAVLAALVYAGKWRWIAIFSSRRFLAATVSTAVVFNSVLFFGGLWTLLVHFPIFYIRSTFDTLLVFVGLEPATARDGAVFSTTSRLYFVFCVALVYGLLRLLAYLSRKYLFAHPDRWWQFSLSGLLALMLILGTGLGLLLRLFGV